MQSERPSPAPGPKLLIVCLRSDLAKIRQIISRYALLNWDNPGEIRILPLRDNFRRDAKGAVRHRVLERNVLHQIDCVAPPRLATRIIIVGHIKLQILEPFVRGRRDFQPAPTHQEFDRLLPLMLAQCSLDWRTQTENLLRHYHSQPQMDAWLQQFGKLRESWIGQALLQLLDFWPDHRVCEALFESDGDGIIPESSDWLEYYDLVACNDPSKGKSAAVIAHYMRRKWGDHRRLKPLPELESTSLKKGRVLFLEDCIMTGKECVDLVKSGRLDRTLSTATIDFKFAVGTQYGICRLIHFLKTSGLAEKIRVLPPRSGLIKNLSPAGVEAFERDQLFSPNGEVVDPNNNLINGIVLRAQKHFNATQKSHILHFCGSVGRQLMFSTFIDGGHEGAAASELASHHCFGFGNLGLLVAFAHSIPDNTIPLFRLSGSVGFNGKKANWVPLFKAIGESEWKTPSWS